MGRIPIVSPPGRRTVSSEEAVIARTLTARARSVASRAGTPTPWSPRGSAPCTEPGGNFPRDGEGRPPAPSEAAHGRRARPRAGGAVAHLARPEPAHPDGRPGGEVGLPVLRGRLRPERVREGRAGRPDRGRPGLADLPRAPLSEGSSLRGARQLAAQGDARQVPAAAPHRE